MTASPDSVTLDSLRLASTALDHLRLQASTGFDGFVLSTGSSGNYYQGTELYDFGEKSARGRNLNL